MSEATPFTPPNEIVSFAPPSSTTYTPIVDGKLEMFPLSGIIGGVAHRFVFSETGGPGQLKPGRPLAQSMPINIPPNAGWFTSISGFTHAFVNGNFLGERPLGQISAFAWIDANAKTLNCNVRLTDSNMDDGIMIQVDALAIFFN
jgi:hypothetical protein